MKEQIWITLQTSEQYTTAVAQAMHEKGFEARPIDGIWNFNELINHIAYGIEWWCENYIHKTETAWNPPAAKEGKDHTIKALKEAYAKLKKTISDEPLTEDRIKGFYATLDHITHHRGQATVYLRLNGIVPPEYVF